MKLKKFIYILLILTLLPCFALAKEEYPYLPTFLKDKVISTFGISIEDKTQLYEKVNIYGEFDAWMIAWFNDEKKIITGITDTEDIIYYSVSRFTEENHFENENEITHEQGEKIAIEFIRRIMPSVEVRLLSSNAFEYKFVQTHNNIKILGREATVVVDKQTGEVNYYKGFGQTGASFSEMTRIISKENAFDKFYRNIGLELVYNTVFDDISRVKTIRPMYILNRSDFKAIDAQTGVCTDIVMHDYNYYYNDDFFDSKYYFDNNIRIEEKVFTEEKEVFAKDVSCVMDSPHFKLSEGYTAKTKSGKLHYYKDESGNENFFDALQVNIVPSYYAREAFEFAAAFDNGEIEVFGKMATLLPVKFARAYIDLKSGRILDFEIIPNYDCLYDDSPLGELDLSVIDSFIATAAEDVKLKYRGTYKLSDEEYEIYYARYENGIRVIGEGAYVKYNLKMGMVTDYSLVITENEFISAATMKNDQEMKPFVEKEFNPTLYYVDYNETEKFVVFDAEDKNMAFDPVTGNRIDRIKGEETPVICVCEVGKNDYSVGELTFTATAPVIRSNKLLVPLSVISSLMGHEISYQGKNIIIKNKDNVILLEKSSTVAWINGEEIKLDISPLIMNGDTYLSALSLRSLFGMFIKWETDKIHIIK